ncbi:hypothetical protein H632_c3788p0 [Helicosporidium sp. ATCC 50920]|nr:hypothetical protein H632_c3788p0 [Helicosporidium sp. ATCC 50920]|eukprot:KDD72147.1 hypothetical protein H632_c3788p0 [Helicosporidium sp. ATCC 50920]
MLAGAAHSCGITAFSHMYCWGDNQYGQLGVGSTDGASAPQQVSDPSAEPDLDWAMGLAGLYNTCGVSKTHAVYCWGRAAYGMNGNSQTVYDATSPVAVSHSFTAPVAMAGSGNTAYLLDQGGDLYVWGSNVDGQSGLDLQVNTIGAPVLLVQKAVAAAGAETYGCYIAAPVKNNVLYCVGGNANGQLGIGSTASQQVPAQVDSNNGLQWEEIAAGPNAAYGTQALAPVQQEE